MKYYKSGNNKIFAFELDGSQDHLIKEGMVKITKAEADKIKSDKSKAKFDNLSYSEKRKTEYPPIEDYIDGVVKGDEVQIQAYIDACFAVKVKYPKE